MSNRRNIVTMMSTVAGVLALSGGCAWPALPAPASNSSSSTTAKACAATSLSPEVREIQGAADTHYFNVIFTNTGATTCSVLGYPVLVLRDARGRLLPPAYPSGVSKNVRLPVGRSAVATMAVTPAACPTVPLAASAAVSPPGDSYSTTLPVAIPVCRPTISPLVG